MILLKSSIRGERNHTTANVRIFEQSVQVASTGVLPEGCELRQVTFLNNLVEQDHRFLKRLIKPGLGFFSPETAWRTLQGYEIMHMIRKGQIRGVEKGDIIGLVACIDNLFLAAA